MTGPDVGQDVGQVAAGELAAMTPDEVVVAHRAGRLAALLGAPVPATNPPGQVTAAQLATMSPDEVVAAQRAGQLDELLGRAAAGGGG